MCPESLKKGSPIPGQANRDEQVSHSSALAIPRKHSIWWASKNPSRMQRFTLQNQKKLFRNKYSRYNRISLLSFSCHETQHLAFSVLGISETIVTSLREAAQPLNIGRQPFAARELTVTAQATERVDLPVYQLSDTQCLHWKQNLNIHKIFPSFPHHTHHSSPQNRPEYAN